ncbi:hypothetical protein IC582_004814 [Cucumis melo]
MARGNKKKSLLFRYLFFLSVSLSSSSDFPLFVLRFYSFLSVSLRSLLSSPFRGVLLSS